MKKIKVLVVDDSAFMRKLIVEFLTEDSRLEVVGSARNGQDAISKIQSLRPDVVTLDVEMPIMNGLEALEKIMKDCPTPVVMLSSTTKEGAENTLMAMQNGAFDFIAKPSGAISLDLYKVKHEIIDKVVAASWANVHKLQKNAGEIQRNLSVCKKYSKIELGVSFVSSYAVVDRDYRGKKIVLIGTSTGGPRALQTVLTNLPQSINAPILVVQHMPPGFTRSLAERLDSLCHIHVKEAEDGELIQKGTAYIAPGGFHLKVRKIGTGSAIILEQSEPRNGHRPSVDVMFESVANELIDFTKITVIMTGMGSDGANGLIELKRKGQVKAIAESQETSIVFGMPKAAIATHLIDTVENVENIAKTIVKYCES
ncbi:chemotaxis response regulator protein-glutamate methylesterase [Peribacillus asahii]|uniref:protein-glutamate methylesterase/protein-glutamine glutaminase n=1 Tax=Peribacillus asahii TaxID=228899 RepID=UPI003812235F